MLLAIDLAAGAILFAIDLRVLLPGEPAAIASAVGTDLLVDALLAVLVAGGLAGVHRAIAAAEAVLSRFSKRGTNSDGGTSIN